jgi:dTDP-4-dehydrorhamnose reductase
LSEFHIKLGHDVKVFNPRDMTGCNLEKVGKQGELLVYYTSAAQTRLTHFDNENDLQIFNVEKPKRIFKVLTSSVNFGELIYFNTCHIYRDRFVTKETKIEPISRYAETKLETELFLQSNRGNWSIKSIVLFPTISPHQKNNIFERLLKTMLATDHLKTRPIQTFCISHARDLAQEILEIVSGPKFSNRVNLDLGTKFDTDDFSNFVQSNKKKLLKAVDRNSTLINLDRLIEPYIFEGRTARKTKEELFYSFLLEGHPRKYEKSYKHFSTTGFA